MARRRLVGPLRSSLAPLSVVLSLSLLLSLSLASAFPYSPPRTPPASQCRLVQSRFCTNVVWPVPVASVSSATDAWVQADVVANMDYTGSRTCKRWYADWQCRVAFPYCSGQGAFPPCLSECTALARRCPTLRVDCQSFTENGCKTRAQLVAEMPQLTIAFTPGDRPINANDASPVEVSRWITALVVVVAVALMLEWFRQAEE